MVFAISKFRKKTDEIKIKFANQEIFLSPFWKFEYKFKLHLVYFEQDLLILWSIKIKILNERYFLNIFIEFFSILTYLCAYSTHVEYKIPSWEYSPLFSLP